jgi:chemotaxis protein methyltransferase CheR
MRFYAETLGLPKGADTLLRDLIHEKTGTFYENGRCEVLTDKLAPLVVERGLESFLDYYYLLKYDPEAETEWVRVMDALSVQETYFWREIDQIHALVNNLAPKYFADHATAPLRIWSAACATGEEPLTIAIALNEAGWFNRAEIEIEASDGSLSAVEKARHGLYRERSFRNLPPALREKYFAPEGNLWRVAPGIQAKIKWRTANLMNKAEVEPLARASIIFCRNVFIYFSPNAIRQTVQSFARLMPGPGYLCVGVSESLLRLTTDFELEEIGGAFIYVKRR